MAHVKPDVHSASMSLILRKVGIVMLSPFLCGKADVVDSSTKMTTIASSNGISGRSRSVDEMVEDGGSSSVVGGTVSCLGWNTASGAGHDNVV